jgi:hypothetical protein
VGLREKLNDNPNITTGITIGVIVVVVGFIVYSTMGRGPSGGPPPVGNRAFYTVDDGATWFAEDVTKVPPFDHDGKQAVRAKVYRCDGKTFVNHMERYTAESQKRLQQAYARAANEGDVMPPEASGVEVKAPGGDQWVLATDPRAVKIIAPKCASGNLEIVVP